MLSNSFLRTSALARQFSSAADGKLFLGLDCSTQGLKATAIGTDLQIKFNTQINFSKDLPEFGTENGVNDRGGGVVNSPTLMFVAALDMVLGNMKDSGFNFGDVAAVSGSGQQHGSVFWAEGAEAKLGSLSAGTPMADQMKDGFFSFQDSPIWMDSSTTAQCKALETAMGGPLALATLTGSRAYERFTGNQIAKLAAEDEALYSSTERISLISSFLPSILKGGYAPVDYSDGAGMNMMDLKAQAWSPEVLSATAPDLASKMGEVAPSHTALGPVSDYLIDTYGFAPDCEVVAWSGDNPCSVAGLGLQLPGDLGLSMGTSDTIFGICGASESIPGEEGHIFVNPVDPESHMVMLCYKNGSLAREKVCSATAGGSWDEFDQLLSQTAPGNNGNIGFFIDQPEITPDIPVAGVRRFSPAGAPLDAFESPAVEARAVLEGQFLSMRLHAGDLGLIPNRIVVTGGASQNASITKVIADVFGVPVLAAEQPDSASLGAAYRAKHGYECKAAGGYIPFADVVGDLVEGYTQVASSDPAATAVYTEMLESYKKAEAKVTGC